MCDKSGAARVKRNVCRTVMRPAVMGGLNSVTGGRDRSGSTEDVGIFFGCGQNGQD